MASWLTNGFAESDTDAVYPKHGSLSDCAGIFFSAGSELLLHLCSFEKASRYGEFLNYPISHDDIWETLYQKKYHVDFDYYPRGRIIYSCSDDRYIIYYDKCAKNVALTLKEAFNSCNVELSLDEHYQCHACNVDYVAVFYRRH